MVEPPPKPASAATSAEARDAFIRMHTVLARTPLVPEIALHLATDVTLLWHATEAWLAARDVPAPFWAFSWAGGQALARFLLDDPSPVAGKRVLDLASGGGVVAIAAARAGARSVIAVDIDPFAEAAARLNAAANGVTLDVRTADVTTSDPPDVDVILAGDVCYEHDAAARFERWLRASVAAGARVLLGDPERAYTPQRGLRALASYDVPTPVDLEGRTVRRAHVWEVLAGGLD
jgi:predicted nicotinamide N-methyase